MTEKERLLAERDRLLAEARAVVNSHDPAAEPKFNDLMRRVESLNEKIAYWDRPAPVAARVAAAWSAAEHGETPAGEVRLLGREDRFPRGADEAYRHSSIRPGDLLRAYAMGPRTEEERALVTSTGEAGGFLVPEGFSAQIIDLARAKSRVIEAGARTVPLGAAETSVPVVTSDPVASWIGEGADVPIAEPTFGQLVFRPKTCAFLAKASRQLLEDSPLAASEIERLITTAMGAEIDRVALLGSGAGAEPPGVENTPGITDATPATAEALSWSAVAQDWRALANLNHRPTALVTHPEAAYSLFTEVPSGGDGHWLGAPSMLSALPVLETSKVPMNLTAGGSTNTTVAYLGDWTRLVIGIRAPIRVEILRERYADNLMVGFLVWMRLDVAVTHPAAFVRRGAILTSASA